MFNKKFSRKLYRFISQFVSRVVLERDDKYLDPCESVQVAQQEHDTMSAFSTMIDTESMLDDIHSDSAMSEEPSLCTALVSAPLEIPKDSDQIQSLIETHQRELAAILKYVKERKITRSEKEEVAQPQTVSLVEDVEESVADPQTAPDANPLPLSSSIPPVF
jgi:hypothetical protein